MMKRFYVALSSACLLGTFLTAQAAPGDTLRIQSHNETHWSWNNTYLDTVQFPTTGSYQKILMHYVLGCPSIGCSEWDYKTNIEVWEDDGSGNYDRFEIARVITPYAGNRNNGWFHEYVIDVTDYAPLLQGEKVINAYYGGFQDGFTISVYFDFIEGTPPRDVLEVSKIYRSGPGGFLYGDASDPIENHLTPQLMQLNPATQGASVRMVATGHGFGNNGQNGNPDNCAEFCSKWYALNVNGTERDRSQVWKGDCGSEPYFAQTGTWVYDRAGWCPGSEAVIYETDISPYLSGGNSVTLDVNWQDYTYTGGSGFPIHYWVESQLIEYGGFNYASEAEITRIVRPNDYDRVSRFNPTCFAPQIEIRNNGSDSIKRVDIEYGIVDGVSYTGAWDVSLGFGETQMLDLNIPAENFYVSNEARFFARIGAVNQQADENPTNDRVETTFASSARMHPEFIVQLRTNNRPEENRYSLMSAAGDTIIYRDVLTANTNYYDTLFLDSGCYELYIEDSGGDGIRWWANAAQGNGSLRLTNIGLNTGDSLFIENIESDFGNFFRYYFTVGYNQQTGNPNVDYSGWTPPNPGVVAPPVSIGPDLLERIPEYFAVYPNPSEGLFTLELEGFVDVFDLQVYNLSGQVVAQEKVTVQGINTHTVDLEHLEAGMYLLNLSNGEARFTQRIAIR